MRNVLIGTAFFVAAVVPGLAQDHPRDGEFVNTIPVGTRVEIRTDSRIDVRDHSDGRIFPATVAENVLGPGDHVLIPRGARAELIVQNIGDRQVAIDIDSISFNGRRYMVDAETYRRARRSGIGDNKRTGEYIGGGAVFGTILGAIAGGGKGAAIGALAGAAAGGSAQVLTRGEEVRIPPESILTFHLDAPLDVANGPDRGYDENGVHYHDGYYDRGGH